VFQPAGRLGSTLSHQAIPAAVSGDGTDLNELSAAEAAELEELDVSCDIYKAALEKGSIRPPARAGPEDGNRVSQRH
jgi:hypothetical protein